MIDKSAIIHTAQKLASRGQIDKAIEEYEKLLASSKDGNVYNTIGDLYLKKGSETEAIVSFTKAAELFKKDGFYPKAIALYKKILNIVPNDVNSLISLGKLNTERGLSGSAIEYYFKAADIYHREGSTENATTVVEHILQLSPSDPETRKKIAYLYFRLGLRKRAASEYAAIATDFLSNDAFEQAEEMCRKAFEFDEENTQALICFSKLAENNGNSEEAFEYLEKAVSFEPDNTTLLLDYASALINHNRTDEAISALTRLIAAHPSELRTKRMLGTLYVKQGLTDKAWEELLPCIDNSLETGNWSDAHELLHHFRDIFPVPAKQRLLRICKAQGDEETIKINLEELALLHEGQHEYDDALQLYKEILDISPDDQAIQKKIDELAIKLGITRPAEDVLQLNEAPDDSLLPQEVHEVSNTFPEVTHFEEALSAPEGPAQKLDAAAPSSVDEDLKDIFSSFDSTPEKPQEDYDARYQAGLECRQKGLLDEAITNLQIAARDPEKQVRNSTMLAMCYMEKGSYPLAITGFTKVMELMSPSDSTYIHVKYELASAYLNNKDINKARELYSEIQAENPDFKDVAGKLSSLQAQSQDNTPAPKKDRVSYI